MITGEHAAFLAAVAARPDDDLPRLVYADYLDETGEADRAEFVRVQVELAGLHLRYPRFDRLKRREHALLAEHRDRWRLPAFEGQYQEFRRGFVEHVRTSAAWLLDHPDALPTAPGPLRDLRIINAANYTSELVDLPGLARVEALDLTNGSFGSGGRLRRFFTFAKLDRLKALALRNSQLWPDDLQALADLPIAKQLRELDVSGNRFGDDGVRVIATAAGFAGLTSLVARANELPEDSCIHEGGAIALAESRTLTDLHTLDLSDHYIGDDGVFALVQSAISDTLTRLAVAYNEIGTSDLSGVSAITVSSGFDNLQELILSGNRIDTPDAALLADWSLLKRMRFVDVRDVEFVGDSREVLERSPFADRFIFD